MVLLVPLVLVVQMCHPLLHLRLFHPFLVDLVGRCFLGYLVTLVLQGILSNLPCHLILRDRLHHGFQVLLDVLELQ